ncbi:hypothetical protein B4100_0115 [Heyndrickxia coagulans]|nr:hypothetical protein B4100_0115 [Heyndrickxia coagulans]
MLELKSFPVPSNDSSFLVFIDFLIEYSIFVKKRKKACLLVSRLPVFKNRSHVSGRCGHGGNTRNVPHPLSSIPFTIS